MGETQLGLSLCVSVTLQGSSGETQGKLGASRTRDAIERGEQGGRCLLVSPKKSRLSASSSLAAGCLERPRQCTAPSSVSCARRVPRGRENAGRRICSKEGKRRISRDLLRSLEDLRDEGRIREEWKGWIERFGKGGASEKE